MILAQEGEQVLSEFSRRKDFINTSDTPEALWLEHKETGKKKSMQQNKTNFLRPIASR